MRALRSLATVLALVVTAAMPLAAEEEATLRQILFTNVNIFDGKSDELAQGMSVLVEGNLIKKVAKGDIETDANVTVIDGDGRTLVPGMIDGHAHVTLVAANPFNLFRNWHWTYTGAVITKEAEKMLLRGFTTIRDAGGPAYGIAKALSAGSPRTLSCTWRIAGSASSISKTRFHITRPSRSTGWVASARAMCCAMSSSAFSGRR